MSSTVVEFLEQWIASGLVNRVEASTYLSTVQPAPRNVADLIAAVLRDHRMTDFQVQAIQEGNAASLTLGNYQLLDILGRGGMGVVYRARHRVMKREVALKMLPAAVATDPELLERFHREVQAAARLNHPHVVTAYDADESQGIHFFCMELVEGNDLASQVKQHGPLPVGQAVNCILQAARGLKFAHERGITHRDIKPSNLLMDRSGTVKVLDMGLARIDDTASDQAQLTSTGMVMGTVDYMAPEQALNTKDADARSDIYSLGISLWYLLTGRPAYEGSSLMARMLAHRDGPLPSLKPPAPPELNAIFQKMIAKDRDDRYQSMADVIVSLETFVTGRSLSPLPPVSRRAKDVARQSDLCQTVIVAPAANRILHGHAANLETDAETLVPETNAQASLPQSHHDSAKSLPTPVELVSATANQRERQTLNHWLLKSSLAVVAALLALAVFLFTRSGGDQDAQTQEMRKSQMTPSKSLVPMFAPQNVSDGDWNTISVEGDTVIVDVAGHRHQLWHNFPNIKGRSFRIRTGLTVPQSEGYAKLCLIAPGQADHSCIVSRRNGKISIFMESSDKSPLGDLVDWPIDATGPRDIAFEISDGRIRIMLEGVQIAQTNVAPDVDWVFALAVGGWRAELHAPSVEYPAGNPEQ